MTAPLVQAANGGSPVEFVRLAREQMAGETLLAHAPSLVGEGRTTIEEAMRDLSTDRRLMALFGYNARNGAGILRQGVLEAASAGAVADQLSSGGSTPVRIEAASVAAPVAEGAPLGWRRGPKLGHADVLLFSRQMHSLLKAGVPIMRALGGLQDSAGAAMAQVIRQPRESLETGNALSLSMRASTACSRPSTSPWCGSAR